MVVSASHVAETGRGGCDHWIEDIQEIDNRFSTQSKGDPLTYPPRSPPFIKTLSLFIARQHANTENGLLSAQCFGPRESQRFRTKPMSARVL
jgi:hypothetical protein